MLHINCEEIDQQSTAAHSDYNPLVQEFYFYDFWNIIWKLSLGISFWEFLSSNQKYEASLVKETNILI